jgi:hypothetical protein
MENWTVIDYIRSELQKAENNGAQNIPLKSMLSLLSEIELGLATPKNAVKFQKESELAQTRTEQDANKEMFRTVIDSGKTALTTCILINGGAAIALMSFLSNAYGKNSMGTPVPASMGYALLTFAIAVFLAGATSGLTYLAQCQFHQRNYSKGKLYNGTGIFFVALGYALFAIGITLAYHGL